MLVLLLVVAGNGSKTGVSESSSYGFARSLDGRVTQLRPARLARVAINWRGGPITTSTGETVTVRVSDSLALDTTTPESWAEFLAKLVHGSELRLLTLYVAPLVEVEQLCGSQALGCYFDNTAVSTGETVIDGTTPQDVVRHEYGHHIAMHRSNAPWQAIDWGPKRWASAAGVCGRVSRREAFPGNEGANYSQNPGEAWAEVYRLMDERKNGILTATWPIIAQSFYPGAEALTAAELDVVQPWTAGSRSVLRRPLGRKGQVWWTSLSTPLDGELSITVTLPRGGLQEVALLSANRRTVLRKGLWTGQRVKKITATVCGQRSLNLRVTQKGAAGQVTVAVRAP